MAWSSITWSVARTSGFVAYLLVAISICFGLVLSLRWRNHEWPRWATVDLHRHLTLLAIVFVGIHTFALWIDPFTKFTLIEIFVPFTTHYRPLWVAFGIVSAYLLVAIWLSEKIQKRVGYQWWRYLHYLTFTIYGMATIHGLASGTDTRTIWAKAIYVASFVVVGSLLAVRLIMPGEHLKRRPAVAAAVAIGVIAIAWWTATGPMQPGWG